MAFPSSATSPSAPADTSAPLASSPPRPNDVSLCYFEAWEQWQAGLISEESYVRYLYAHCSGVRHVQDSLKGFKAFERDLMIESKDPFAWSVKLFAKEMDQTADTKPFEDVFAAYRSSNPSLVRARLRALGPYEESLRNQLAFFALRDRNSKMLKLCMDEGLKYENSFCYEARNVNSKGGPQDLWGTVPERCVCKSNVWG